MSERDPTAYLSGLVPRLAVHEDKAWDEVRTLDDPALIEAIAAHLKAKPKVKELAALMTVLGYVTRNTASARGKQLIMEVLERPKLHTLVLQAAIYAAAEAQLREALPIMRELLARDEHMVLDYLKALRLEESVDDIGAFIVREMSKKESAALLGIFALEEIGTPNAAPHFLEYAQRAYTSKRAQEQDWRHFSLLALGTIGDASIVDALVAMLERMPETAAGVVHALAMRGDARGYPAILAWLEREVQRPPKPRQSYSEPYKTPIINALELIRKVGKQREPVVLAVLERLAQPDWLTALHDEERRYLSAYLDVA